MNADDNNNVISDQERRELREAVAEFLRLNDDFHRIAAGVHVQGECGIPDCADCYS